MFWEVYALDRQEYLKSLTEQIRTKRARTMVAEEVEAHIEDQKQDFMAHGLGEEEAESMAVVEMGDPVEAGVKLDRVHRPKMEWTVLMAILIISIMGLILQAVVTSSFPTMNMSTPILLMDEPFGALDAVTRSMLQDMVLKLWEKQEDKKTVFFVTHDVDEAMILANRIIVLGQSPSNIIFDVTGKNLGAFLLV